MIAADFIERPFRKMENKSRLKLSHEERDSGQFVVDGYFDFFGWRRLKTIIGTLTSVSMSVTLSLGAESKAALKSTNTMYSVILPRGQCPLNASHLYAIRRFCGAFAPEPTVPAF